MIMAIVDHPIPVVLGLEKNSLIMFRKVTLKLCVLTIGIQCISPYIAAIGIMIFNKIYQVYLWTCDYIKHLKYSTYSKIS